jgi:hypothetical protein
MTVSLHILSNSLLTYHPFTRRYVLWFTKNTSVNKLQTTWRATTGRSSDNMLMMYFIIIVNSILVATDIIICSENLKCGTA